MVLGNPSETKREVGMSCWQAAFVALGCDGLWSSWTALEALTKTKEIIDKETRRLMVETSDKPSSSDLKAICKTLVD